MKISKLLVLLAGAVICSSVVQAASEEIIVTGTRSPLAVDKLAASTTVMTREDIEQLQVNSLPDLLKGVAGLDVTVSGGYGKTTSA